MDPTPRFRFRDEGMGYSSTQTDSSSDQISSNSDSDNDFDLESMTGKGIKRLCSELLELKKASHDDFHSSVYANYSAFLRIVDEAEGLENNLMEFKQHISTQKSLVDGLMDSVDLKALSEEIAKATEEEDLYSISITNEMETHSSIISETFDVLLLEQRLDEAFNLLEMESVSSNKSYQSTILEMKRRLAYQYAKTADHPRVCIPEFQHALTGLHRLGETQLAHSLLLQYYRSRLADRLSDLQNPKPFMDGIYPKELANIVFSTISQAARSFIMLEGETVYSSEFIDWVREATEEFAVCFDSYVKSVSETIGGLAVAVESVQCVWCLCTSLQSQNIMVRTHLVNLIRPCMEEVLHMHIEHFRKVIGIFASVDNWVLGKFLISGLQCNLAYDGNREEPEFFLLTSSGRKLIKLLQTIMEDVSPLVFLRMESTILKGFADLFMEYVGILEKCITIDRSAAEQDDPILKLSATLPQKLSIIINSSTIVTHLLPSIARLTLEGATQSDVEQPKNFIRSSQQKELENWVFSIHEAERRLQFHFCQQFVAIVMSPWEGGMEHRAESCFDSFSESATLQYSMPSANFQVLYLRLRQLEKVAEELAVGSDWKVKELLTELMKAAFEWLSGNHELWKLSTMASTLQQSGTFLQFVLDVQFLVEIARSGEFVSESLIDASLDLMDQMETAFREAGCDLSNLTADENWASSAAKATIVKLQECEKTGESLPSMHVNVGIAQEKEEANKLIDEEPVVEDVTAEVEKQSSFNGKQNDYENEVGRCSTEAICANTEESENPDETLDAGKSVPEDSIILKAGSGYGGNIQKSITTLDGSVAEKVQDVEAVQSGPVETREVVPDEDDIKLDTSSRVENAI